RFQLFSEADNDTIVGIVKSQTDPDLFYACSLNSDGVFSCCTQNLKPCGGMRGSLCKHLLVLMIGLTKSDQLTPVQSAQWCMASCAQSPKLNKDKMADLFLKYKGAQAGEIDWRPTETIPEDYYAF